MIAVIKNNNEGASIPLNTNKRIGTIRNNNSFFMRLKLICTLSICAPV